MLTIKTTAMNKIPENCDECVWFETRPHPHRGWTDICQLEAHCLDDDQPEEWIYSGNGRADACPLIEINAQPEQKKGKWIGYKSDNLKWLRDDGSPVFLECSACNTIVMNNGSAYWNFCPNCGADMRGEE